MTLFAADALEDFGVHYPETPFSFAHNLRDHPLFALDALAALGDRHPAERCIGRDHGASVGADISAATEHGVTDVGDRIRRIEEVSSWCALLNVDRDPEYRKLCDALLAELRPHGDPVTGEPIEPTAYIFVTSPGGTTPYHFDPDYNMLFQIRGRKDVRVFPAHDTAFAPDEQHEAMHADGNFSLPWREAMDAGGTGYSIAANQAVFIPYMAPHYVANGPEVSVSFSLTWGTRWTFAESEARNFNRLVRRVGLAPRAPARWPATNRPKSYAYRLIRRLKIA